MKKKIVAGNWKMNLNRSESIQLVYSIIKDLPNNSDVDVILSPSFINLYKVAKICKDIENLNVAAQDCSAADIGPFTSQISARMIASVNAHYVILGHSETRVHYSNKDLYNKVINCLKSGLQIIFCCGEDLKTRQASQQFKWIESQLSESLFNLKSDDFANVIIAYEPIWAIGTGITASPQETQEMHAFIRGLISSRYNSEVAENTSIIYGGSCNSSNAKTLFNQNDVDGGLIGGASLNSLEFISIIKSF